jgi:hypothetical protein
MWLSTKRVTERVNPSSSPSSTSSTMGWKSSLPLDWTRVQRNKEVKVDDAVGKSDDYGIICCQDPVSCRRLGHRRPENSSSILARPVPLHSNYDTDTTNKIHGQAIFCLHDLDPSWVQGFFLQRGCKKPWGLLAIQEEIDDCLACSAGGYRRLSLTVYRRHESASSDIHRNSKSDDRGSNNNTKPCKIEGVDWTGGDMMSLYHPYVDMVGERLLTGEKALPMLNKYFQSLINRLEKECCEEEGLSILEWLPNVAIVMGSMSLTLPTEP